MLTGWKSITVLCCGVLRILFQIDVGFCDSCNILCNLFSQEYQFQSILFLVLLRCLYYSFSLYLLVVSDSHLCIERVHSMFQVEVPYSCQVVVESSVRLVHYGDSQQYVFYGVGLSPPRPTPILEDQVICFWGFRPLGQLLSLQLQSLTYPLLFFRGALP